MGSGHVQGEIWGTRARDWAELQEPQGRPMYEAVFDAAGVGEGTLMLDAACGAGLALAMAYDRGAEVAGVDASRALLEVARERVSDAELRLEDIEEISFGDDTFEVVTSFNGVQFAEDRVAALRELGRVARPGGAVVVTTWAEPDRNDMTAILAALRPLMPPPPDAGPHSDEEGPFALSRPGLVEELLSRAGLEPESAAEVECPFQYRDEATAMRALGSAGPFAVAARELGEERLNGALAEALAQFARGNGSYRLDNRFRYVLARA
jgi:SAM-dependent methyltransferase